MKTVDWDVAVTRVLNGVKLGSQEFSGSLDAPWRAIISYVMYSPTLEGFRAIFRRPSLGLAEIAWRWSIGFAVSLLLIFSVLTYLNTLPVTAAELLLLRTGQPVFILQSACAYFQRHWAETFRRHCHNHACADARLDICCHCEPISDRSSFA